MLALVRVQEVRWDRGGTTSYGNGIENHELRLGFSVHKRTISAFKSVEFVSDRMYYINRVGSGLYTMSKIYLRLHHHQMGCRSITE
jgi:CRISPR/Cas system-associated protein Cas7 (RAMP superfamily)